MTTPKLGMFGSPELLAVAVALCGLGSKIYMTQEVRATKYRRNVLVCDTHMFLEPLGTRRFWTRNTTTLDGKASADPYGQGTGYSFSVRAGTKAGNYVIRDLTTERKDGAVIVRKTDDSCLDYTIDGTLHGKPFARHTRLMVNPGAYGQHLAAGFGSSTTTLDGLRTLEPDQTS